VGHSFGADRIAPKRWLALYAVVVVFLVGLTILIPARYRVLSIGCTYLTLATTFIPLNVTAGVLFMASGKAMPDMLNWLVGSPGLRDRIFGTSPENYPVLMVALAATLATVVANLADYHAIAWLMRVGKVRRLAQTKFYGKIAAWFNQAPFIIIFLINALAVPFGADRLLAAPRGYSRPKFAAAVFLGRLPRYYIVALVGQEFKLTWWQIIVICAAIALLAVGIGKIRRLVFRKNPVAPEKPESAPSTVTLMNTDGET
jgi:membrane protein YqaA with SNARE-associated domain